MRFLRSQQQERSLPDFQNPAFATMRSRPKRLKASGMRYEDDTSDHLIQLYDLRTDSGSKHPAHIWLVARRSVIAAITSRCAVGFIRDAARQNKKSERWKKNANARACTHEILDDDTGSRAALVKGADGRSAATARATALPTQPRVNSKQITFTSTSLHAQDAVPQKNYVSEQKNVNVDVRLSDSLESPCSTVFCHNAELGRCRPFQANQRCFGFFVSFFFL